MRATVTMYTVKEIAKELRVTERTVRRWVHDGKLKALKVQGILRVEPQEYQRFLRDETPNYRVY